MSDPGAALNQFGRLSQHGDGGEIWKKKKEKKVEDLVGVGSEWWDEPFVIGGDKKRRGVTQSFPPFLGSTPRSSLSPLDWNGALAHSLGRFA